MCYIDKDGNLAWFIPLIIGAAFGSYSGYQYAHATDRDPWLYMLGGAAIGAASGGIGAAVSGSATAVGGMVTSSYFNSLAWAMMTNGQTPVTINMGIGSLNLNRGRWSWADFKGDAWSDISTVAGYADFTLAAMEDLHRLGGIRRKGDRFESPNKEKITETTKRDANETFKFADKEGNPVPDPGPHEKTNPRYQSEPNEIGAIHGDERKYGTVIYHYDAYASGSANPLTIPHHLIFDAGPTVMSKFIGGPAWLRSLTREVFNTPYYLYRTSPRLNFY